MFLRRCVAVAAVFSLLFLAACGGDRGTSAPSDDGTSDSEEIQSSSSSQKVESSSSVILSVDSHEESSSSSSSSLKYVSSSSWLLSSSSNGWDWYVPKEARLNPEIAYDSMTDSRDGQIYKTVKIGDQIWMAENLNYADSIKTPSLLKRSLCFNDKAENCVVAGRLYTWAAAIDSVKLANDADNPQNCGYGKTCTLPAKVQGVCPDGWHLPTKTEWETLFTEVGGQSTASKILRSQTGWNENGNGTDGVGFSVLPVGGWYGRGFFNYDGYYAHIWSATENLSVSAYYMYLSYDEDAGLYKGIRNYAFSVRCLRN